MAKLYLIRRNMESFAGPMSLVEMKDAYKRMTFGLQDEVSGHCGPWVSFDNLEVIKRQYPEVARIVHEDMLAGWGVSEHGHPVEGDMTKRLKVKSNKSLSLAIMFAVIALSAFLAAVFMANGTRMSSRAKDPSQQASLETLQAALIRKDSPAFDKLVEDNLDSLVSRAQKDSRGESPLLPYLRHYAFTHDGAAGGLPPKVLRGEGFDSAPTECSFKLWRRYWRSAARGTSSSFANDRKFVRDHWARILAWDPYWIRRRAQAPVAGWLAGDSYYIMCLSVADRALTAVTAEQGSGQAALAEWDKLGMNKMHQRLQWILEVARDGLSRVPSSAVAGDSLSQWTCFEAARDLAGIARCKAAIPALADDWQAYSDERANWSILRLAASQRGTLSADIAAQLAQAADKVGKADFFTRFDYRAEQRLFKSLAKSAASVPVEKAVEKVESEFPDVKMAH